jgi:hypothetical protein
MIHAVDWFPTILAAAGKTTGRYPTILAAAGKTTGRYRTILAAAGKTTGRFSTIPAAAEKTTGRGYVHSYSQGCVWWKFIILKLYSPV